MSKPKHNNAIINTDDPELDLWTQVAFMALERQLQPVKRGEELIDVEMCEWAANVADSFMAFRDRRKEGYDHMEEIGGRVTF